MQPYLDKPELLDSLLEMNQLTNMHAIKDN